MANVKISELPVATTLNGAELVPVVQAGVTKQTTIANIPPFRIVGPNTIDIYVNADTGSNSNSGLTSNTAFLTIQKAVDVLCANYYLINAVATIHVLAASNAYAVTQLKPYVGTWNPDPGTPSGGAPDSGFTCPRILVYNGATVTGSSGLGCFVSVQAHPAWCIIVNGFLNANAGGYCIQADFGSTIYVAGSATGNFGNAGQGVFIAQWNSQIEILRGSTLRFSAGGGSGILARATRGGQILVQAGGTPATFLLANAAGTAASSYSDCPNFTTATAYADTDGLIDLSAVAYSGVSNGGFGAVELTGAQIIDKHLIKSRVLGAGTQFVIDRRTKLQGAATYYVNFSTGNDGYDGLSASANADTHRGPFKTPAACIEWIARYIDTGGYAVTINLADGTYSAAPIIANLPFVGGGAVSVVGNTTTPANVDFACTGVGPAIAISNGAQLSVSGVRVACTDNNSINVTGQNSKLTMNGAWTSAATAGVGLSAANGAEIHLAANYTLSDDQLYHWLAFDSGRLFFDGGTLTISAGVDVTYFVVGQNMGLVKVAAAGATFSGSLNSGNMGLADGLSLINDGGTTLPGTGPITTSNGGIAI